MLREEFSERRIKLLVPESLVVAAVVVLGQVQLGNWGSGAHGQHHLRVLDGRDDAAVVVAARVQQSGASGLHRVARLVVAALAVTAGPAAQTTQTAQTAQAETANVSDLAVSTAMSADAADAAMTIAGVDQDGAQLLAAAITGTGNDLNGTVIATGSSGAGCGRGAATLRAMSVVGDSAESAVDGSAAVAAAADGQIGADEYRKGL